MRRTFLMLLIFGFVLYASIISTVTYINNGGYVPEPVQEITEEIIMYFCKHENSVKCTDIESTCMNKGKFHFECCNCGCWLDSSNSRVEEGTYFVSGINKNNHSFISKTEVSCTQNGVEICERCGEERVSEHSLGHDYVCEQEVSCTEDGIDVCTRCGKEVVTQEALGHALVDRKCVRCGYTAPRIIGEKDESDIAVEKMVELLDRAF